MGTWVEINGPKGSVVAFIDDECPECKEGDIDLGPVTFEQIADKKEGRVPITWRYVPGQVTGPILYYCKEGSSKWHIELQIRNHRYAILSVEIKTFDSEWYNMKRTLTIFFILPGGVNSKEGPYIVRVKDIFGQELIDTLPTIKSEVEYSGLRNFPVYNTQKALPFSIKFTSNKSSFVKTMNVSTLISFCKYYKGQIEVFSLSGKNDGNDRNKLDLYWFYFSDVNDSGTSQINNAEYLGNGAYSRVKPVLKDSQSTDYCAKMEFKIGNMSCLEHAAPLFVGIGTDIALTNEGVDISEFDSISFEIYLIASDSGGNKINESLIEFNIISDYGVKKDVSKKSKNNFYHYIFNIPTERRCNIVIRKDELWLYPWGEQFYNLYYMSEEELKIYLNSYLHQSYKITWRILGGEFCGNYWSNLSNYLKPYTMVGEPSFIPTNGRGIFYLDNIRIYPSTIFSSQVKEQKISFYNLAPVKTNFSYVPSIFYDFQGRKISVTNYSKISNIPLIYQKTNRTVLKLR